jgi:hypothetical protein
MADSSEWAKKVAAEFKRNAEADRRKRETFVAERKFKSSSGPLLWNELREGLKEKCRAFNVEVGEDILLFEIVPDSTVKIRRREQYLDGTYDAQVNRTQFNYLPFSFSFSVKVDMATENATWFRDGRHFTSDELSGILLRAFLNYVSL